MRKPFFSRICSSAARTRWLQTKRSAPPGSSARNQATVQRPVHPAELLREPRILTADPLPEAHVGHVVPDLQEHLVDRLERFLQVDGDRREVVARRALQAAAHGEGRAEVAG